MAMRNRTLLSAIGDLGINLVVRGTHRVDECCASVIESPERWGVRGRQSGGPQFSPFSKRVKIPSWQGLIAGSLTSTTTTTPRFSLSLSLSVESPKPVGRGDMRPGIFPDRGRGRGRGHEVWLPGYGDADSWIARGRPGAVDQTCAAAAMDRTTGLGTGMHDDAMTVPTQPRESGTQRQCHRSVGS